MIDVESVVAKLMHIDDPLFIPLYEPREQRNKFYPAVATPADLEVLKRLLTWKDVPFSDDTRRGNFVCFCDLLPVGEDDSISYEAIVTPTVFDMPERTYLVYPYEKPLHKLEYTITLDLVPGDLLEAPVMTGDGELSPFYMFSNGIKRVAYVCEEHLNLHDMLDGLRIRRRLERTRAEMKYIADCAEHGNIRISIKSPEQGVGIVEAIRECPYWEPKDVLSSQFSIYLFQRIAGLADFAGTKLTTE
jgi:hypothetical protein